jgi:hypothetical protein
MEIGERVVALPGVWPPEVGSEDETRRCIECGSGTYHEGPRIYRAASFELPSLKDRDAVIGIVGDGQVAIDDQGGRHHLGPAKSVTILR